MVNFCDGQSMLPLQMNQDGRINGAGASAHHQAFERSEAHSGSDRHAVSDSGGRAATPQMARYQAQLANVASEQLGGAASTIRMADAMKSKPAYAPIFIPFVGERIDASSRRKLSIEGSVKNGDLRHPRQCGFGRLNRF